MSRASKNLIRRGTIIVAILFMGGGMLVCVPTEMTYFRNTGFVEERLRHELSINQVEFVAGKFRRESMIVYRVLKSEPPMGKFRQVISEAQRRDCAKSVSEIMASFGIDAKVSANDDFFEFYGSDYSVILLRAESNTYLIYLGAQ